MKKFILIITCTFLSMHIAALAQNDANEIAKPAIFSQLTDNSDKSKGVVVLHQDARIVDLVYNKKVKDLKNKRLTTTAGFRVQVFSSNQQHTAKVDAYKVEEKLKEKFPQYDVYVSYFSPFWKVRTGDCLSTAEAATIRDLMKKEFPEYSKEMYIVKDQVFIPED